MKKVQRFSMCSDDSGHCYAIPVEQVEEFYKWLEDDEASTYTDCERYDEYRVEGSFCFTDPRRD